MPIIKPPELQEWLREFNYEILGIPLLFGDWIEIAIDWLLEPINYIANWAEAVSNWLVDFRAEVLDVIDLFLANLNQAISNILNTITAWGDILGEWWEDKKLLILGWIEAAIEGFNNLKVAWDNFWTTAFPNLVNFQWLTDWWGNRLSEIDTLITSRLQEWFPFYNTLSEMWNSIVEFFIDPLDWLETRFTDWFLGKE